MTGLIKEIVRQKQQEDGEKIDLANNHAQAVEDAEANGEEAPPALEPFVSVVPGVGDFKRFFMGNMDLNDPSDMNKAQYIYMKLLPKITGKEWSPTARIQNSLIEATFGPDKVSTWTQF